MRISKWGECPIFIHLSDTSIGKRWKTSLHVSAYQAHHYLDVFQFFSRTLAWFVPLKLCFVQVLTAIVSGSNASDIHQFRSWLFLWSRIQEYLRFVYVCKVGLSRNRLICKLKWIAQNGLYQTPLVFPSLTFSGSPCKCAQMHDWSIPHCRMKLTSFRHPAPKISSKKLVKSDTLRYLGSSWLILAHLGSTTRQRFMNSGQVDHGQQTKTAQNYGRSEGVHILHTGIYVHVYNMCQHVDPFV